MTLVKFANGPKNFSVNPFFHDVFDYILCVIDLLDASNMVHCVWMLFYGV